MPSLLATERQTVVDGCRAMARQGLVVGTAGNVSVRSGDLIAISPSGVDYETLQWQQVGVHDLTGAAVDASLAPSTELALHLALYASSDAAAITHNHAPASTALGLVVDELPTSHYYTALFGGTVRVAPYATFGTVELARTVTEAMAGRTGALMANHGAVTIGSDLAQALSRLQYLEYLAEVQLRALATGLPIKVLSHEEISVVADRLGDYGQKGEADG